MDKSYIPKLNEQELCEWMELCSIRKTKDWKPKVCVKDISWNIKEELLETVINSDTYDWKDIVRVYASGHVFLNDKKDEVFLVTVKKGSTIQHQFTWGEPLEEEYKKIIYKEGGVYKFDIEKARENARIRTKNRTWVEVIEEYNKISIVDWVLMENEEDWKPYYKLVCLMHFVPKKYKWELTYTWKEDTIWWKWYKIKDLPNIKNIAPNVEIVVKKAIELLNTKK